MSLGSSGSGEQHCVFACAYACACRLHSFGLYFTNYCLCLESLTASPRHQSCFRLSMARWPWFETSSSLGAQATSFSGVYLPLCVCVRASVCACVPVCLCAHMLVRRPLPRRVVHAHKAAVFVSTSSNTTLLGSLHVHRFDLATGAFDGLTLEANRNAQLMGFDGQNVCVSDSTGKAQCFKGELHCSVNGVVNGAFSLAVWPASSLACSLVLWGR